MDVQSHPDAELHVFSTVNFHALIKQANLFKVFSVHHKAANQGRAPEIQNGKKGGEVVREKYEEKSIVNI